MSARIFRESDGWAGDMTVDLYHHNLGWVAIDLSARASSPAAVVNNLVAQRAAVIAGWAGESPSESRPSGTESSEGGF